MKDLFLVTGASRGLGKAMVEYFSSENSNHVIGICRNKPTWRESKSLAFAKCDLALPASIRSLVRSLDFSPFKTATLISNAGVIGPLCGIEAITNKQLIHSFQVNAFSPILLASCVLNKTNCLEIPTTIVNVSSGAAFRPIQNWAAYCSSKAASHSLFNVLSLENKKFRLLHFDPGVVDTDMQQEIRESNFPGVDNFRKLKDRGELTTAKNATQNLACLLDDK